MLDSLHHGLMGLTMFERLRRGLAMAGASWSVLKQHPKLVVFPVLSGVAFVALVAAIVTSVFGWAGFGDPERFNQATIYIRPDDPIVYAVGFAFYFACTFIVIF